MNLREEFVLLARHEDANRRELCRRYGISPQTAYKWLARYAHEEHASFKDRSKRPHSSPGQTETILEGRVVTLRQAHPQWGGRKLSRRLQDLGHRRVAPSTITGILHRHGLISPQASAQATPWQRFEHDAPNDLWQMDFKGYFQTTEGVCHPLTVLDDHSRFNVGLRACTNQRYPTVQKQLIGIFTRYGMPVRINTDNGPPWGAPCQPRQLTELAIWLIRLGVRLSFSRPYHPQTNGKDERFHRTLKAEVLNGRRFHSLNHVQAAFDTWREVYNHQRPHEALAMATPTSRYRVSPKPYDEHLPDIEYGPTDTVVTIKKWDGVLRFKGRSYKVSNALRGQPVAIRANVEHDGLYDVFYIHHKLMEIDLRTPADGGA